MRGGRRRLNVLHKPRLLALALALAVAALAVFATETRAGSFDSRPQGGPDENSDVLEAQTFLGAEWSFYQDGGWPCIIFDNFGYYTFPKADVVGRAQGCS
jgi:hypothetical protein